MGNPYNNRLISGVHSLWTTRAIHYRNAQSSHSLGDNALWLMKANPQTSGGDMYCWTQRLNPRGTCPLCQNIPQVHANGFGGEIFERGVKDFVGHCTMDVLPGDFLACQRSGLGRDKQGTT